VGGGGGGGGAYIHIFMFTYCKNNHFQKEIRTEHKYMNIPPPPIIVLGMALI
jgi:hypothetical protein